ncbi:MAG: alkaline phosphatase family protein [Peptococcaceae bacterium]|nr:alkaline phosphatase family protein [Peptococcaceae bacterium]
MQVLEIFIDGLGLGMNDPLVNPVVAAKTPFLDTILHGHNLWGKNEIHTTQVLLKPLEATLGVPGVPQSATGQTTLWTGVNAAQLEGRHINAYPTTTLQKVIAEHSLFKQLKDQGYKVTFANAFSPMYFELVTQGKRKHATSTLSTLAAGVELRSLTDLRQGKAVYQDITNHFLDEFEGGFPVYSPQQAGLNLANLAAEYDFTLFEYFQTDLCGHKQELSSSIAIIERIDSFLSAVAANVNNNTLILVTSDHGNVEDITLKGHTTNPVPLLLIGDYARTPYASVASIGDLAAFVVKVATNV